MATLGQVGELVTRQLRERVDGLVTAVDDEGSDLAEIVRRADAVGELADAVAEIYRDIDERLERGLDDGSGPDDEDAPSQQEAESRRERGGQNGESTEDVTKEELLERAREVEVPGRSSMTKDELTQAVEAEESLTKEDLLERARDAGIEGRSGMSKKELRKALREAGA
jgi:hypothetical protein